MSASSTSRTIADPGAIDSFHHLRGTLPADAACRGLACFAARADDMPCWTRACEQSPVVYCLGQCHAGPASAGTIVRPSVRLAAPSAVLLENVLDGGVRDLDRYRKRGGSAALARSRAMKPEHLIRVMTESGLRGRGGAGFSAGRKWKAVRESSGDAIIVVNADEGDPGAFSDKALLEDDPFRLIEGIAIAARAVDANQAVIYLRCEYPDAERVISSALAECEQADWPGGLNVELVVGGGGFVCGEETSLLNALEGRRPFARARPPYPFTRGFDDHPTLVHNVETLCAVPWIIEHGAEAYRSLGSGESAGTKLVSLNSLFQRPGLVELPFGIPVREIVDDIGGGVKRGSIKGVMIGGPLAGLLPPHAFDTLFTYEHLHAVGCAVGHGGIIAFADDMAMAALIAEVFRFGAVESCGLCVPCHLGTEELARAFDRLIGGAGIGRERWNALIAALEQTSLCGHGSGLAEFARSLELHYPEELFACLR